MASRVLAVIRQNSYTVGRMEPHQNAIPCPEITFLTQDEVRRLFAVITGKRDRALFQLAYHHGLRASEVSLLQRADVHEKQGRIYIPRVKRLHRQNLSPATGRPSARAGVSADPRG
jgi:integrase